MNKAEIKRIAGETKRRNIPFRLDESAVHGLIERIAGEKYSRVFEIRQMASPDGYDAYELFCEEGKVRILAASGSAAAVAFDTYLKKYCGYTVGFLTVNGTLPEEPPLFSERIQNGSAFHYRYLYNYCTFAYSYAFSGWEEWERVLDRVILAGYNLVLNPIGHEAVWKKLLEKFGYSGKEVRKFLVNPAFLPFLWMMNMSDYGGDYPEWWFEERAKLAKKFNARLESFGIGIMLPGYCGMVPDDFKVRFPKSRPVDQGFWNGFPRPSYILPGDKMFDEFADAFYELQKETVNGGNAHYFSVDPFHEGGISDGIDLKSYAKKIMAKMKEHDEQAVWFFQGWQQNPRREMLAALDKSDLLVGNLLADTNGESGDNFGDSPWLYCNVNNFGAQHVMRGSLKRTLTKPHEYAEQEDCTMVGVGYMPEGVENDEVFFDIFGRIAMEKRAPTFKKYIPDFLQRRYGKTNENLIAAWTILAEKVYLADSSVYPMESVFCARPSLEVDRVSTWGMGCSRDAFEKTDILKAVRLLFTAYEDCKASESYRFDLVDILRQCNAMAGWKYAYAFLDAYKAGDKESFSTNAAVFFELFKLQEKLVSSDRHFLLGKWLEKARESGRNEYERRWLEFYARVQITLWSDERSGYFHEYAAKEWQGMLADFYLPRWEAFVSMLELSLYTGKALPVYKDYDREITFAYGRKSYPLQPITDTKAAVLAALTYYDTL